MKSLLVMATLFPIAGLISACIAGTTENDLMGAFFLGGIICGCTSEVIKEIRALKETPHD